MKIAEAYVEIRGDMRRLQGDLGGARSAITGWMGSMGPLLRSFGLVFGGYQIMRFMRSVITETANADAVQRKLAEALRGSGQEVNRNLASLSKYASAQQRVTMYGDEQIKLIAALGISLGKLSADKIPKATEAAIGWAEVLGIDAVSAMNMIARAAQGNFMLWSRYDASLSKLTTDQEKWNAIMARGADYYLIHTERAKSLEGAIGRLKNTWGDFKESIGKTMAPVLEPALRETSDLLEILQRDVRDPTVWGDLFRWYGKNIPFGVQKVEPSAIDEHADEMRWRQIKDILIPPWLTSRGQVRAIRKGDWRELFAKGDKWDYETEEEAQDMARRMPSAPYNEQLYRQLKVPGGMRPTPPPIAPGPPGIPLPSSAFAQRPTQAQLQQIHQDLTEIKNKLPGGTLD